MKFCPHWDRSIENHGWTCKEQPKGDLICYACLKYKRDPTHKGITKLLAKKKYDKEYRKRKMAKGIIRHSPLVANPVV